MKKLAILLIILAFGMGAGGKEPAAGSDHIVWFGLDYSHVKFIGFPEHFSDLSEIRDHYFGAWNHLIITESEKYDIRGAFLAGQVTYSIDQAVERSQQQDMRNIVQAASYELTRDQLAEAIKSYVSPSAEGTGVVFIMETLNKLEEVGTMWVAVFDISTGELYHLKRYSGKPGGFGFRNYWARPYYNVINELKLNPPRTY
jgi:hypothetical protein